MQLDRRTILAIAALVDADPRTVRKHLRGEPVVPALAHAIDAARRAIESDAREGIAMGDRLTSFAGVRIGD
jgi:hypothetical protein